MISNITNALPMILKQMKSSTKEKYSFNLLDTLNFYNSILPSTKRNAGLKHIFLDCVFSLKDIEGKDLIDTLMIDIPSLEFIKDFIYEIDYERNALIIRANCEDLAVFSLIILGSIKHLKDKIDVRNHSIFVSLAKHFLNFCIESGYNVCNIDDIKILEDYNGTFDKDMFMSVGFLMTSEHKIGTIHFVGVEMNKDIMKIFEKYHFIRCTYNEENSSFIISLKAEDWNDFWKDAPLYLKKEFTTEELENNHKKNIA